MTVCSELRLSVLRQVSNDKGEEEICAIGACLFIQSTFLMPNSPLLNVAVSRVLIIPTI